MHRNVIQDLEGNVIFYQGFEEPSDHEFYFLTQQRVYSVWRNDRSKPQSFKFEKEKIFPTVVYFEYPILLIESVKDFIHDLVGDIYIDIWDNEEIWIDHISKFFTCLGITYDKEED